MSVDPHKIVESQVKQIEFLMIELGVYKRENAVLKAALTHQTIEAGKSFKELRDQFDALAQQLHDLITHWVAKLQRPLTYDEIIKYYRIAYPKAVYTSETICRRVRELAEEGWLHSPEKGTFIPVAKEVSQ